MSVALDLTRDSLKLIRCLEKELGKRKFEDKVIAFFNRQVLKAVGSIRREFFGKGKAVAVRTGLLSQSITGRGERFQGVPAMRIGVFKGPALQYAGIQEFGTRGADPSSPFPDIVPKKAKALTVPIEKGLTPAGVPRPFTARTYPGELRFIPFRSSGIAIGKLYDAKDVARATRKNGMINFARIKAVYLLITRAKIPGKHFLRDGMRKYVAELAINLGAFLRTLLVECTRRVA